jgi:hypothetical protein
MVQAVTLKIPRATVVVLLGFAFRRPFECSLLPENKVTGVLQKSKEGKIPCTA